MQAIVDSHVHLIEPDAPGLSYAYATTLHPVFGGVVLPAGEEPWTIERLAAEPADPPVARRVHVQSADPACDPVLETRHVAARAQSSGQIHALVVRAPLLEAGFERVVDAQLEASALVRGVRDMSAAEDLGSPAAARAARALERRGLVWDAHCRVGQVADVLALARRRPDLQIVLTHAALAGPRPSDSFEPWRAAIAGLAQAPNVSCKISGLGIGDHAWTVASLRPWVLECVAAFGPGRCLFGSNWPVDRLFSSYQALLDGLREILAGLAEPEVEAIFSATATRVYRL